MTHTRILFLFNACLLLLLSACDTSPHTYKYGITPIHTIEEYQERVTADSNSQLIDLGTYLNDAELDIRYATTNNFTGEIIYNQPRAFALLPVAKALSQVEDSLAKLNLHLIIFDAYRPYSATVKFYEVYKDTTYVASPYSGSRHNRGCAVDVSIAASGNKEILMPTEYDDFSERAHPTFPLQDSAQLHNRELLIGVMSHFGFSVYPSEWWHFDFQGWNKYPLLDLSFEQLDQLE